MRHFLKIKWLIAPLCVLFAAGCNDSSPGDADQEANQAIREKLEAFHASHSTRADGSQSLTIDDVVTQRYYIVGDSVVADETTRAISDSFELKRVSFTVGNQQGFSVLSTDPRIDRVFFYTENGHYDDSSDNGPLNCMLEDIPYICRDFIRDPSIFDIYLGGGVPYEPDPLFIAPLVRFKWSQGSPFNMQMLHCTKDCCKRIGNHRPAGCVAIALAQTIATIGHFNGTFYGTRNLNFDELPNKASQFTSWTSELVSQFVHEITLGCQMKITCDGSGTTTKSAANYLEEIGYNCEFTKGGISLYTLRQNLKQGRPHIMGGNNAEGNGHEWVIDGIKENSTTLDFHCNWGWGGLSDGWVYGNPYVKSDSRPTSPSEYSDNKDHIYINGFN